MKDRTVPFRLLSSLLFVSFLLSPSVGRMQDAETSPQNSEKASVLEEGDPIAEVKQTVGLVYLHKPRGLRARPVQEGTTLFPEDTLSTTASGKVVVRLFDGSTVIMEGVSRMRFRSPTEFYHERGVAYFDILSEQQAYRKSVTVHTDFAIAGVKGTEFIINASPYSPAISLNEGELEITNPEDQAYELVRRRTPSGFEDYKNRQMDAFEQWKSQLIEEFIGYRKSFTLQSGKQILFNGRKAVEESFSSDITQSFEQFRDLR